MRAVEWTRLEGGQVEAVVAMFVNRERPDSVRISPSRGDGGVDILDRRAGPDGSDVVYQVKRFTGPLSSRQKGEVAKSLETLFDDKRWVDLAVGEWILVMPWDPTPEAEQWLQGLEHPRMRRGMSKIWRGLTWVDQQAARYDDVVDYYLHGGRSLVEKAYAEVMAVYGVGDVAGLSVPDVQQRVQAALRTLDHDPHYIYEHRFGAGQPPSLQEGSRPRLVLRTQIVDPSAGRWSSVDIIARCVASVEERPITIKGAFTAQRGSDFAESLAAFLTYGAPFTSPDGAFEGVLDAPGGLGGAIDQAKVWVGPSAGEDVGTDADLHLEILDSTGVSLAAVDIRRIERSRGIEGGWRAVFEEINGLFTLEERHDLANKQGSRNLRLRDWTGKPVGPALDAARFLSELQEPNVLRFSIRNTPASQGVLDRNSGLVTDVGIVGWLRNLSGLLEMLVAMQRHTSALVLVPDLEKITSAEVAAWRRAVAVLAGDEVSETYPEGQCIHLILEAEVAASVGQELVFLMPLNVPVGQQIVALGQVEVALDNPTIVERRPHNDGVVHVLTTPDRAVRWRKHP